MLFSTGLCCDDITMTVANCDIKKYIQPSFWVWLLMTSYVGGNILSYCILNYLNQWVC